MQSTARTPTIPDPASTPAAAAASWSRMPALPDKHGFAAAFAGVSNGVLLFGGGANFPQAPLAEGGTKVWNDRVFALTHPDAEWTLAGRLPGPRGYGVSVPAGDGVLCIGGSDASKHHDECFLMAWRDGALVIEKRQSLPQPLANMAGARCGDLVYVIGGTAAPCDVSANRLLFALDLRDPGAVWQTLDPIPGEGRILPVAAVAGDAFHVVSGATLAPDASGNTVRAYLTDAWVYQPGSGWSSIAPVPVPVVAAPGPAIPLGQDRFLIAGGDDGCLAALKPGSAHPGFPRRALVFDRRCNEWSDHRFIPDHVQPPVTAPTVEWLGNHIIASGEVRPGIRSPQVWEVRT